MHEVRSQLFPFEVKVEDDDTGNDTATIATDHGCVAAGEPEVHEGPIEGRTVTLSWRFPVEDPGACSLVNFKQGYMYHFRENSFAEYLDADQYGTKVSTDFVKERTIDSVDDISAWGEHHIFRDFDEKTGKHYVRALDRVHLVGSGRNSSAVEIEFTMVLFDIDRAQQRIQVIYRNGIDQIVSSNSSQPLYTRSHSETNAPVENAKGIYATTPNIENVAENLTPEDGLTLLSHKVSVTVPGDKL